MAKNIESTTRELLESDVESSLPTEKTMKGYPSNKGNRSYIETITLAMIIKAVNGNTRAATLILNEWII